MHDASGLLLLSAFLRYRISLPSWLYPSSIFGLLIGLREQ